MKKIFLITILGVISMLTGCRSSDLNYYNNTKPEFDLKEYFTGNINGSSGRTPKSVVLLF